MDHASPLWCRRPHWNRPGSHFFFAGREVALQAQRLVSLASNRLQRWFLKPHGCEHLGPIRLVQFGDFRLQFGANRNDLRSDRLCIRTDLADQLAGPVQIRIVDIGNVKDRFGGHQPVAGYSLGLNLIHDHFSQGQLFVQLLHTMLNSRNSQLGFLVATASRSLCLWQRVFQSLNIRKH